MKIYEVRCYGGEYEDAFDDLEVAYMTKEAAEKKAAELRQEMKKAQAQNKLCANCPIAFDSYNTEEEWKVAKERYKNYAPCVANAPCVVEKEPWGVSYNCTCHDWTWDDRVDYYVKEVEVIEE